MLKIKFEPQNQKGTVKVKQQMETWAGLTPGYNPKNITFIHIFSHTQIGYAFFEISKRDEIDNDKIIKVKYKRLKVRTYDGKVTSYHIGNLTPTVVGQYSYEAFDTDRTRLETYLVNQINDDITQLLKNKAKITQNRDQCIQLISNNQHQN